MRILRVAQKAYPDVTGGGAYHVHAMSRDQAAMGHDVTVLTVGDGPRREERDGYTVIRCPSTGSVLGNDIAPGVWRHLRSAGEYDVVHAHSHLYFATNLAAVRRRLGDTPLAITNHGLYSQSAPEWMFDAYLRTAGRWTFDTADVVFCYTETDRERLREYGVSTDVAVVPNGIDTVRFTPDGRVNDRMPAGPTVLFVGRLVAGKRPGDALEAFARIVGDSPDSSLVFVGEGPRREELERETRSLGLDERVQFLGHLPYEQMPSVYRSADVLVLPSRAEGLPRTVLEAMASGTPVVVSDLPQVRPVVEGTGAVVPVGDVDGISSALDGMLDRDMEGENVGVAARERIIEDHDWSGTVERTTRRLHELCE